MKCMVKSKMSSEGVVPWTPFIIKKTQLICEEVHVCGDWVEDDNFNKFNPPLNHLLHQWSERK